MGSLLLGFWALAGGGLAAQEVPFMEYARVDPAKVVTVEACGECHVSAYEVWKGTPHATTFKTMHRKERAETIAGKLGFGLIKRDAFCFSCHYTPVINRGAIKVVSGVSCESCHGAGADWIEVHNDYGEGQTDATESVSHRESRIAQSRAAGMRRPSDLYDVAANCFGCHSVPDERLVNLGGHSTGSAGFELVEWTQGEIRHNFLESFKRGEIGPNITRPAARQRVMYVVGRALDLEYSLRGAAVAKGEGVYSKAMSRRVRSALSELRAVDSAASITEVGRMMAAVRGVRVGPGNEQSLLAAADAVEGEARAFLARADADLGSRLAALDPLVAGQSPQIQLAESDSAQTATDRGLTAGTAEQTVVGGTEPGSGRVGDGVVPGSAVTPTGARATQTTTATPGVPTARSAAPTRVAAQASGVVGEIKRRIRPASSHRTLGSNACSGCHERQNEWWFGHAHYRSADPFFEGELKNQQIARLYGIRPGEATTGSQLCMDCHGTVVSGKEARDVLDGVSCESCHGPAADWLEPHKDETDKELGRQRPGYQAALAQGKTPLDLASRAEICTGCHYITEPRLLSAGHPSGAGFDYVAGMNEVRHWETVTAAPQIVGAFEGRLAARGAVPQVAVASLASAAEDGSEGDLPAGGGRSGSSATASVAAGTGAAGPGPSRPSPSPTTRAVARSQAAVARRAAAGLRPPAPRPARLSPTFEVALPESVADSLELGPFPEIDESTPIEDALLLVKQRLDLLYASVAPAGEDER